MGLLNQQPQKPAGRKATPEEQNQYKTLVQQVVRFLSSPKMRETLKQTTEQMGPEKALAMIVGQAVGMSGKSAQQSGVNVPASAAIAAIKEIVTMLASMMASAGIVKDVQQTVAAAMQLIQAGMSQQGA